MKSWLQDNDLEIYSTHNEAKSVASESSIKNSKNKVAKYSTLISNELYIDKLNNKLVNSNY